MKAEDIICEYFNALNDGVTGMVLRGALSDPSARPTIAESLRVARAHKRLAELRIAPEPAQD